MVTRAYFARRFLALKLLRSTLVAGALYDAGLAAMFLWRPAGAAALLGFTSPALPPMAAVAAIWLVMLAALGLAAGRDARRYSAIVATIICGRAATALLLATGALVAGRTPPWSAAWNALLSLALAAGWWPQRQ